MTQLWSSMIPRLCDVAGHVLTVISTSSGLALVPMLRCPNYCATKAALHHFLLALREQLKESRIKVVEILPPAVQSRRSVLWLKARLGSG